jgi:hypothetical protein
METENTTMKEFLRFIKNKTIAAHLIPMEMGMGWPILSIRNNELCVTVPFYRAIRKPQDNTLLYPLAYTITALWPKGTVVAFQNLKFSSAFNKVDFSKPIGTFRHDSIKHLNKEQYEQKVDELFDLYDKFIKGIQTNEPFAGENELKFKEILSMLMEPSHKPMYMALDHSFFQTFLG